MARRSQSPLARCLLLSGAVLCGAAAALPQPPDKQAPEQEIVTQESPPTFKLRTERNLVLVRVVVRDSKGKPVPKLRQEDFQLFDSGKPQTISVFSIEEPASKPAEGQAAEEREVDFEAPPGKPETTGARRFLGLYFDDQHIAWDDLTRTQQAAARFLSSAIQPGDRVGIFTSSGQDLVDFTDDLEKIKEDLSLLRDRPPTPARKNDCPYILDYQAFKIVEMRDPYAMEVATNEALACQFGNDPVNLGQATSEVQSLATVVLAMVEHESASALRGLELLIRRMSVLPGERNIVLISPGFLTLTYMVHDQWDEVIGRALRANVTINSLDVRGLYALDPTGSDIVAPGAVGTLGPESLLQKVEIYREQLMETGGVLSDTAQATGGVFFHNNNDLDEGFRQVRSLPEVYYVLGFSPSQLKYDGRFHSLKVRLTAPGPYTLQARRGYYAPHNPPDSAAKAKEDIREAAFSRDEIHELPVHVNTQFFKLNDTDARLSVLTRVDVRLVRFRKEEGRNLNNLTFLTVVFDRDGKYLIAKEKTIAFHLRDTSLEKLSASGLTSRASFDLKAGNYLVRQVVRDSEGGQISALNRTVEIPY